MSPAMAAAPPSALAERFQAISLAQVVPSKTNPRTHFDDAYLKDLAQSILDKGLIQPIVVRPRDGTKFEIVAGECRWRASKIAGLEEMPAIVRSYSDDQVLEIQLIENIHRTDLTPLEQAVGYRRLIASNPDKHSAETIAQRIGMSPAWVWDRLKLNDLIPEAKTILEHEWMSVGHAILIARLKPEDQQRVIAFDDDASSQYRGVGLWRQDSGFSFDEDDPANKGTRRPTKYEGLKTCSVRELETWIRYHVRFDVHHAAKASPLEFESIAQRVDAAAAQPGRGKKVIAITFDHYVQPEARAEDERTYGPRSFKLADGQEHIASFPRKKYVAHTCEHSVLGVVAAGDRQGQVFAVCIARDTCAVHWKTEITAKEKNAKLRESGQASRAAENEKRAREREEAKRKADQAREDAERAAWKKATPALTAALVAGVKKADPTLAGKFLLEPGDKASVAQLGKPKAAGDYLRVFALGRLLSSLGNTWHGPRELPKLAAVFGVDVAAILKAQKAATKPAAKKGGKPR